MCLIRHPALEEYDAVHTIYGQIHALHAAARPDIYDPAGDPLPLSEWKAMFASPDSLLLVAQKDARIAGISFASLREIPASPMTHARRIIRVDALGVSPDFRRQGIATKLWQATLAQAHELHAQSVELQVWDFNQEALRFYEKIGMTSRARLMELPF